MVFPTLTGEAAKNALVEAGVQKVPGKDEVKIPVNGDSNAQDVAVNKALRGGSQVLKEMK